MFSKTKIETSMKDICAKIQEADAIVIGAGAGLSTAAGYEYAGERFNRYFSDFEEKYGIHDMYSGGFYPYDTLEEYWAWWSRQVYYNRYVDHLDLYQKLFQLVKDKDYFVLTTNVDHCFQRSGFDKERLFYMQGDYGLWQCSEPCHQKTYDNEEQVKAMGKKQKDLKIPSDLVPYCPVCQKPMTMNLRCDNTFVQDEGWYKAKNRYDNFINKHKNSKVVYLEIGVGANTPVWIKYPFWKMTMNNPKATYVCINYGEAIAPDEIKEQSISIDDDIGDVINKLQ